MSICQGESTPQYLPNDTISLLETIHVGTNLVHLAADVAAKDGRPLLDEGTGVLHVTVERADGDGGILHDDLPHAGFGHWGVADRERGARLVKPCGLVLWCRHVLVLYIGVFWVWIYVVSLKGQTEESKWVVEDKGMMKWW